MAKIIEFFVPSSFRKEAPKWIPPEEYGKVIPFSLAQKKSGYTAAPQGQPSGSKRLGILALSGEQSWQWSPLHN
jgi:hypothetical protein